MGSRQILQLIWAAGRSYSRYEQQANLTAYMGSRRISQSIWAAGMRYDNKIGRENNKIL